ncbi:cell division protein FtsQ [Gracilibacillus ureilyticus]|uniref:Cell division protein DivIB n=1 Tax=Gracilibacillus ureilyticus TaxID=531814 RepID=A0A1H9KXS7_9BACI|nr:FtsQ-type POTRA domain-containing protein [Gracilibacillus ureilyticus]SER03970.1 cell division protein FtsQ [Gracilibacillus ureilyticus]
MEQKRVVSIEDRIPQLKKERRKRTNRKLAIYLTVFFLLVFIVVYIQSPLSHVNKISITGENMVSEEEILEITELDLFTNYWSVQKGKIEEALKEHVLINNASIEKKFPANHILIEIDELQHVGYLENGESAVPLLENGETLEGTSVNEITASAPLLKNFTDYPNMKELAKELNELPNYVQSLISEIKWSPTTTNSQKIVLYMIDGYEVELTAGNFSELLKTYPSIVSQLDEEVDGVIKIDEGGAVFTPYNSDQPEIIDGGTE